MEAVFTEIPSTIVNGGYEMASVDNKWSGHLPPATNGLSSVGKICPITDFVSIYHETLTFKGTRRHPITT